MDNRNIDHLIPVICVFPHRNFQLPVSAPVGKIENPPNLSPDHNFGNNYEMEESNHDNDRP
jgi:hypothetical protein